MTNKDKQLLLKDLCGRLPYETRVRYIYSFAGAVGISGYSDEGILSYDKLQNFSLPNIGYEKRRVDNILPYLRPMSSMTEEEKKEYKDMNVLDNCDEFSNIKKNIEDIKKNGEENYIQLPRTHAQDYLNSIHVDYRGLIEKGLAFEAPEGMYNTKTE